MIEPLLAATPGLLSTMAGPGPVIYEHGSWRDSEEISGLFKGFTYRRLSTFKQPLKKQKWLQYIIVYQRPNFHPGRLDPYNHPWQSQHCFDCSHCIGLICDCTTHNCFNPLMLFDFSVDPPVSSYNLHSMKALCRS